MSFGIAPDEVAICYATSCATSEERAQRAHRDYARVYSSWIHSLEEQAADGNRSARSELNELKILSKGKRGDENLLSPAKYDWPSRRKAGGDDSDDEFGDPADLAIDRTDPREAIVDFESVSGSELEGLCDHFSAALVWATTTSRTNGGPDLMQMGVRWLAIFTVFRPQLIGKMNLRLPATMISGLRASLNGRNPIETGTFFRKPLSLIRRCTSLLQLGKRGYSAIYVLRGDLIGSATCAAIGALDNKSRQAANKPIQEFRDTYRGIKSLPMRGKETRNKCKKAHEKN